jgi:tetratricopeptide (TPR) repeat protein
MKKKYVDQLSNNDLNDEKKEELLGALFQQHFNEENKKNWAQQLEEQGVYRSPGLSVWKNPKLMAAASIVLLLCFVAIWKLSQPPSPEALALQMIESGAPVRLPVATLGNGNAPAAVYIAALEHYENRRYTRAVETMRQVNSDALNDAQRILLGLSLVYAQEYPAAIVELEKIPESSSYIHLAQWYLTLSYVQTHQRDKARTLAESIVQRKTAHAGQARQLLQTL